MDDTLVEAVIATYREKFPSRTFTPGESFVPVSGKIFDEHEMLNMVEAVMDGWWTGGRFSDLFERRLAKWVGVKYAALVNSGSSANLVAFSALTSMKLGEKRLKPGDEVISVAAGFPTTVNPIVQHGLIPVFVDVELGTYNVSIEHIKKAITPKTRAIFLAHTLGNPYDLDEIVALCEEHDLWFIEDNCDGLGSQYNGKKTGTFGHVATCSFYPAHHITMGEGGAVFTNNPRLFKIIESIRDWGRDCWCDTGKDDTCGKRFCWQLGDLPFGYDHKYTYSELGYNLKVTDMQAALGLAQLEKLDGFVEKRKENFAYLYEHLKKFEKYFILPQWSEKAEPSWFGFLLSVKEDAGFTRTDIIQFLNQKKIGTRLLFAGNITKQPYFVERQIPFRVEGTLDNTDFIMNNTFWIGVYPGITEDMLEYVVKNIQEFINK
ncbi:MAG: lipopolysaccharide biosynthesis protein RfbH [Candidatus Magasanikbacteria bacterium CG_4_10_14_0_2_um_filter_41_10]|uniref:Lipopolysaccharide biosynthesis protein RfbH n=1 Tax=Candidatus Magasanikbacteria bacterium CG_4_10_14_0_2_um_filter_41_10 TaxID=1974638 RepID=A0A2M7V374_9BACT|nr:MAG: lipopolysaccharide biosynthesis protein RfbH [Candidatus Magasanikbacteria bacterium CG_4_10_14_0_2_um_filter_41_10]